ncbi:MAG TPA: alkaline phosphatase family protein [Candidatus Dormibacteraeota bacterium]|nr:alkaline phosphatase family protein [Candidatus Dormibacteraeota bacterium]
MTSHRTLALILALAVCATAPAASAVVRDPTPADLAFPHYQHILVIVDENEGFGAVVDSPLAPTITALGKEYGEAAAFYAETHPSEPNYVAMIGGSDFGIQDDDAYYCKPGMNDPHCKGSTKAGFVDHTVDAPNLASQLDAAGLTWRGYFGAFDPGHSDVVFSGASATAPAALYGSKHNPFMNFSGLRKELPRHIFPQAQLARDLAAGTLPNFAYIVPDQCDDMHGIKAGPRVPADCRSGPSGPRIARGDRAVKRLVDEIRSSATWKSSENVAIVITFDENDGAARASGRQGCCGSDPATPANAGGGRIPTIVITNHGPRQMTDRTPYNHYSLLRSIEDAFGIHAYLAGAGDWRAGVRPMTRLFAVTLKT